MYKYPPAIAVIPANSVVHHVCFHTGVSLFLSLSELSPCGAFTLTQIIMFTFCPCRLMHTYNKKIIYLYQCTCSHFCVYITFLVCFLRTVFVYFWIVPMIWLPSKLLFFLPVFVNVASWSDFYCSVVFTKFNQNFCWWPYPPVCICMFWKTCFWNPYALVLSSELGYLWMQKLQSTSLRIHSC